MFWYMNIFYNVGLKKNGPPQKFINYSKKMIKILFYVLNILYNIPPCSHSSFSYLTVTLCLLINSSSFLSTSPFESTFCSQILWVHLFSFHTSEIMQCLSFYTWLISLKISSSKYFASNNRIPFYSWLNDTTLYTHVMTAYSLFIADTVYFNFLNDFRVHMWRSENNFQDSALVFLFAEAVSYLFLLLYCVLQDRWPMTLWKLLLGPPPILQQEYLYYRCVPPHLDFYRGSRYQTQVMRVVQLVHLPTEPTPQPLINCVCVLYTHLHVYVCICDVNINCRIDIKIRSRVTRKMGFWHASEGLSCLG